VDHPLRSNRATSHLATGALVFWTSPAVAERGLQVFVTCSPKVLNRSETVSARCRDKHLFFTYRRINMIRNSICMVAAVLTVGIVLAQNPAVQPGGVGGKNQPTWAKIIKVEGNKIVLQTYDPKTKEFGKSRELTVTPDALKVFHMGKDNKQIAVPGGLKAETFQNIGKEGVFVRLHTLGDNVTQICVYDNLAAFNQGITNFPGADGSKE
jgi:hypothetical protein